MDSIIRVSHILPTYFTRILASELIANYEKQGKHWSYYHIIRGNFGITIPNYLIEGGLGISRIF